MAAFKDILVQVDDSARAAVRLDLALGLAERHQAHLVALHPRFRSAMSRAVVAQLGEQMDAIFKRGDAAAAAVAKALVESRYRTAGTAIEWRDVCGDSVETVALHARYCDLVVVGQTAAGEAEARALADALLLTVGRPVLVVPYAGTFATVGKRVLVAWNASREATRAVHDALPILERADLVHVMAINPDHGRAGHGDIPGADICLHLSRHGVKAVCEHITADDLDPGEMLLSRAADEDCDLIVMGGYGHSRMRQLVLGGTTRQLLAHMTVPVLFSH